jgi:hypothetical protein
MRYGVFLLLMMLASPSAYARDSGQFANSTPEMKAWFDGLKSGKGPCCSDADGSALSDTDCGSGNGHYCVRIEDEWVDVPDDAVTPNPIGSAELWCGRSAVTAG